MQWIKLSWNDGQKKLTIERVVRTKAAIARQFRVQVVGNVAEKEIKFEGARAEVAF